ncbi:hypothetical protein Cni_G25116 [Canna indica]|uniref:Zinc-ribbon domain-containing protein n=1 Tax=Canna indica TaxID=4628 RepID=A0AAQ3KX11_9LILI|nr:hypothetical protein Cni_G25116 [Canna indica]
MHKRSGRRFQRNYEKKDPILKKPNRLKHLRKPNTFQPKIQALNLISSKKQEKNSADPKSGREEEGNSQTLLGIAKSRENMRKSWLANDEKVSHRSTDTEARTVVNMRHDLSTVDLHLSFICPIGFRERKGACGQDELTWSGRTGFAWVSADGDVGGAGGCDLCGQPNYRSRAPSSLSFLPSSHLLTSSYSRSLVHATKNSTQGGGKLEEDKIKLPRSLSITWTARAKEQVRPARRRLELSVQVHESDLLIGSNLHSLLPFAISKVMATAAAITFRFVRCPKCKKILAEFANIPVYQCGGCDTTLRSKTYSSSRDSIIVGSQELPESLSFDSVLLPSFKNEMTVLESVDGVQNTEALNPQMSNLDDPDNSYKEVGQLVDEENSSTDRGIVSESLRPTDERNNMQIMIENDPDYNSKSSEPCQQAQGSSKLNKSIQDSTESTASLEVVSSVENETNRDFHDGNEGISISTTINSNSYYGIVSSGDGRFTVRRRIGISRRTFKQRTVQDSEDTNEHKASAGTHVPGQEISQEPPNEEIEGFVSNANESSAKCASVDKFESNANNLPTENTSHKKQNTSLDSEEFHSVQNWFEPENDEPLEPLSTDAYFKLTSSPCNQIGSPSAGFNLHKNIQMEILRKVDELREEIGELFDKPHEEKGRSLLKFIQESRPSMKPDPDLAGFPLQSIPCVHFHHEENQKNKKLCRACHHDILSPTLHMSPTLLHCCHNAMIEHDVEKPNKGRKQQIKRHCRPVLGGAPFVICYNCLELLQLPIDFFIAMKRLHKLRCGSCSEVLLFSFKAPNRRVPNQSTSEAESSTYTTLRNEMYNAHLNNRSQSESITFSEEFADILGMRRSADVESSISTQIRSSKLEAGLQLHKLMGYGSASELLYRHSLTDIEFDITRATTPHRNSPVASYLGDETKERSGSIVADMKSQKFKALVDDEEGNESPEKLLRSRRAASPLHELFKIMRLKVHKGGRKQSDQATEGCN